MQSTMFQQQQIQPSSQNGGVSQSSQLDHHGNNRQENLENQSYTTNGNNQLQQHLHHQNTASNRHHQQHLLEQHSIDEQALRLVQEPFVKRIEEMFKLVKEKLRGQPKILHQFMGHCRQFGSEEEDYETPIIQIFNLLGGDEDLSNLFIELLPEQFVSRMFPHVTQKLTENFERFVQENTSVQTYQAFHQIVLEHYNGVTGVGEFRAKLETLFEGYPQILNFLPTYFCESPSSADANSPPPQKALEILQNSTTQQEQIVQNGFTAKGSKAGGVTRGEENETPNMQTVNNQQQQQGSTSTIQQQQVVDLPKTQKQSKNDKQGGAVVAIPLISKASGEVQTETQQAKDVGTKGKQTPQPPAPVQNKIPEALQQSQLSKAEVNFFVEQIPEMLKGGKVGSVDEQNSILSHFKRLFYLYVEGVITQFELFELLTDFVEQSGGAEKFAILQDLVGQRDASRREGNQLLKPISEVDIGQFRVCNKVAPSYYKLPPDYLVPVCSGRFSDINARKTLNDQYCSITSGTEDYKFKIKNVHEDNLFKNEDDMYRIDHSILQLANIISKLEKEQECAKEWLEKATNNIGSQQAENAEKPGKYMPCYLRDVNFSFIQKWYEENFSSDFMQQRRRNVDLSKVFTKKPVEIIDVWLKRLKGHKEDLLKTKEDKFDDWKHLCQSNFAKSLDHRSFFFKKEQKDLLPNKKQLEELKQIAKEPLSMKSACQLKGGSSVQDEFYSTYASFKLKSLPAYTPEALTAPSLVSDHPINLRDNRFLDPQFRDKLPQMRFLINDTPLLETVFKVLIQSLRVGITGKERSKIEDIIENLTKHFFRLKLSYEKLYEEAKKIDPLEEDQVATLSDKIEVFYAQKVANGWKIQEQLKNSQEEPKEGEECKVENKEMKDEEQQNNGVNENDKSSSESANEDLAILKNQNDSSAKLNVDCQAQLKESLENLDQAILLPQYTPKYSLLLATNHFYYVFKLVVTIYERLVFAKRLISEKVDQDLANEANSVLISLTQEEQTRFAEECKAERFRLYLRAVIGTVSQTPYRKLDSASYEDIVRNLVGAKAFLLFVIDKPITQLLKNMPALKTYDECRKTLKLFQNFCKEQEPSEYTYLVQLQSLMQTIPNFNGHCIRLLYSPQSGILSLHQFSLSPYPKMITTATGTHIQTNGNDNKTSVMGTQSAATFKTPDSYVTQYVKQNLYEKPVPIPSSHQHHTTACQSKDEKSAEESIKEGEQIVDDQQLQTTHNNRQQRGDDEKKQVESVNPKESPKLRMPVFLARNRRIMKQVRKHLLEDHPNSQDSNNNPATAGDLTIENNLVIRQVPMICKIQYEANTTDTLIYKRRRLEEALPSAQQTVQQNFKRVLKLTEEVEKQRLRQLACLSSQEDNSEEKKEQNQEEPVLVDEFNGELKDTNLTNLDNNVEMQQIVDQADDDDRLVQEQDSSKKDKSPSKIDLASVSQQPNQTTSHL